MRPVFVVEDEDFVRHSLEHIITRKGFEACSAEDGQKALDVFADKKPGLVFLDINLPILSGDEVFKKIKSVDPSVKVFFVTGGDSEIQRLKDANTDAGYILKPVQLQDIYDILDEYKAKST